MGQTIILREIINNNLESEQSKLLDLISDNQWTQQWLGLVEDKQLLIR